VARLSVGESLIQGNEDLFDEAAALLDILREYSREVTTALHKTHGKSTHTGEPVRCIINASHAGDAVRPNRPPS